MNSKTLLLRQVHPSFMQADGITSQVFTPTPKDDFLLSVYNGEKYNGEESHIHYVKDSSKKSIGVVAVSHSECSVEKLICTENNTPFDGHSIIDYTNLSNKEINLKSKKLKFIAKERGWLYEEGK